MPSYPIALGGDLIRTLPAQGVGPLHLVEGRNALFDEGAETLLPGWEAFLEDLPIATVDQLVVAKNPAGAFEILAMGEGRVFRMEEVAE